MKSIGKRTLIVIVVFLVVMQFIHPEKNSNAAVGNNDITKQFAMPDSVRLVLSRACFNCHTNNTVYPWYSRIQPLDWWMNDHISEGKRHLNFSEFCRYTPKRQAKKMKEVATTVEKDEMPLNSYLWIHKEAILTAGEKKMIEDWANGISQQITLSLAEPGQK